MWKFLEKLLGWYALPYPLGDMGPDELVAYHSGLYPWY